MNKTAWLITILAIIHFGIASYFNISILGGIPHIPDSATYYRQAILLSHGQLYVTNSSKKPIEAYMPPDTFLRDGNIYFKYDHFWPLLLALPVKFGLASFFNPLLSVLSLFLVFLIAKKLYNERTACVAALIYCFSPFVIIMAGDYMVHTATQFFCLAALYSFLSYIEKQKISTAFLAGFFTGYAFNLRPLTAIGFFIPVAIYLLYRKVAFKKTGLFFVLAFIFTVSLFFADNWIVMGNALHPIHPMTSLDTETVGIAKLNRGWNSQQTALEFLPPILFYNFIPMLFIGFALIPLIVLRKKEDFLLFSIFLSLLLAYTFTGALGIHGYGPRYFFEAIFIFFILAGRTADWMLSYLPQSKKIITVILIGLLLYNIAGLVVVLPRYQNYNWIYHGVTSDLKALNLSDSIVVIGNTWNWFDDGAAATLYDPTYTQTFIIKELQNNSHQQILDAHPEKKAYLLKNFVITSLNTTKNASPSADKANSSGP